MQALTVDLADASATEQAGAALARVLAGWCGVVHLEGDLGAGKTTFARGFLRQRGVRGSVRSPTYTLMEPYESAGGVVLHMDLYRLQAPSELWELGLDSYPPDRTLWLVEWPERGGSALAEPALRVQLAHAGEHRRMAVTGRPDLLPLLAAELKGQH